MCYTTFSIFFAGTCIRFSVPFAMQVPPDFRPFLTTERAPDVCYEAELLTEPLCLPVQESVVIGQMRVFRVSDGWLRVYRNLTAADGCQTACLFRENGCHTLYLPASDLERFQKSCTLSGLIAGELLLMSRDCFLLHSSVVSLYGRTVLFSGPSNVGKSTQAGLWQRYLGAEIVNGDRCAVSRRPVGFYGCGSPYCGSSGIYRRTEQPIQAVIVLQQAASNRIRRMGGAEAFRALYEQCIINPWDADYMNHLTELLVQLIQSVSIYKLDCTPDAEAVRLVHDTLFYKGKGGLQ